MDVNERNNILKKSPYKTVRFFIPDPVVLILQFIKFLIRQSDNFVNLFFKEKQQEKQNL